jgi:hypothetical protein
MSKPYAHRLIQSSEVAQLVPTGTAPPSSERVARELAPLKNDPEKLRETREQVTKENPTPTAREVRDAVQKKIERPNAGDLRSVTRTPYNGFRGARG